MLQLKVQQLFFADNCVPSVRKDIVDEDVSTWNVDLLCFSSVGIPFMCQQKILMEILGR